MSSREADCALWDRELLEITAFDVEEGNAKKITVKEVHEVFKHEMSVCFMLCNVMLQHTQPQGNL